MVTQMADLFDAFISKLCNIFSTTAGWFIGVALFIFNLFIGYETSITAIVICVVLDTIWGISVSIKRGKFTTSELGRTGMLTKWLLYASVMLGFICIEKILGIESQLPVSVVSTAICLVEIWSMSGSALILYPQLPFLRLLRKALKGEIAKKLGIAEDEVENELNK